jgi:hypothetical protein
MLYSWFIIHFKFFSLYLFILFVIFFWLLLLQLFHLNLFILKDKLKSNPIS